MWVNKRTPRTDFIRFSPQEAKPLQRQFQWRYTGMIASFVSIAILASVVPVIYFFNQNYDIFVQLAYDHSPNLVQHLEQEKTWLNAYLITMAATAVAFCFAFSFTITARIVGPILVLQSHLKTLTRGNWNINEITIRDRDEFRELIATYNYFYYCLRQVTKEDLHKLQSLSSEEYSREALFTWQKMIEDKSNQLGVEPFIASASNLKRSHDSRHAS